MTAADGPDTTTTWDRANHPGAKMILDYDALVIGSGFGGAAVACRLAEAGYRVGILERGQRWHAFPTTPRGDWRYNAKRPDREHGLIELRPYRQLAVMLGAGVGGGSLLYSGITTEPSADVFQSGWPAEIDATELRPFYGKTEAMLDLQRIPESQRPVRRNALRDAAASIGVSDHFSDPEMAITFDPAWQGAGDDGSVEQHVLTTNRHGARQGTCIHYGNCSLGCPVSAKNSVDLNYISRAEQCGAAVLPLHVVNTIEELPRGSGYRVGFHVITKARKREGTLSARIVVLGAGSIGSTELLLRARDQYRTLPGLTKALGQRWNPNGDAATFAYFADHTVRPFSGPQTQAAIHLPRSNSVSPYQITVEDAGLPSMLKKFLTHTELNPVRALALAIFVSPLREAAKRGKKLGQSGDEAMERVMQLVSMAQEENYGTLQLRRSVRRDPSMRLRWDARGSRALFAAIKDVHYRLIEAKGGVPIEPPFDFIRRYRMITHPIGGCPMGTTPEAGVVDHAGEVFGYRNLYVADGSVIPVSLGTNPSKTIAALAERTAHHIVAQSR
jgi:cholesterol oxidase